VDDLAGANYSSVLFRRHAGTRGGRSPITIASQPWSGSASAATRATACVQRAQAGAGLIALATDGAADNNITCIAADVARQPESSRRNRR